MPRGLCRNCETPLRGRFCHACGQKERDVTRSVWVVLAEGVSEAFELDGRLLRTLGPLLLRPGYLVRAYVDGARHQYTSPVRVFVFAVAIGVLALQLGSGRMVDRMSAQVGDRPVVFVDDQLTIDLAADPTAERGFTIRIDGDSQVRYAEQLQQLVGQPTRRVVRLLLEAYLDRVPVVVVLVLVPGLALLLGFAFPKFLLLEHLLLSLHVHALFLLGQVVAMPLHLVGIPSTPFLLLLMPVYLWLAIARLYPKPWLERVVKFAALAFVYAFGGIIALAATVMVALSGL